MKKKFWTVGLILWLVLSIALLAAGMVIGNLPMVIAGIVVLCGGAVVISLVMIIIAIVRSRKKFNSPYSSNREDEDVHPMIAEAERAFTTQRAIWHLSSVSDKIFGTIFLVSFIGCAVLFVVFCSFDKFTWGLIAWGCGAGVWLIGALCAFIGNRKARKEEKENPYKECKGRVISCESLGGDSNVVYEIVLEVEGRRVSCFANRSYRTEEVLDVLYDIKHGRAVIK